MKLELWHAFVLGAVLSWGVYVPVLHEGQSTLAGDVKTRSLRASNEDFQLAVFDTQSGTGLPVPFGTAIKTNPESLNGLALVPAEEPAPVYTSI